ncbi:hypothetical protein D3C76_1878070 [compost metagenome]
MNKKLLSSILAMLFLFGLVGCAEVDDDYYEDGDRYEERYEDEEDEEEYEDD